MSNLPANSYNNVPGAPPVGAFSGQQPPISQPHFGLKQDSNSNSPIHGSTTPQGPAHSMNNYNQSSNSSPAFNRPGMLPPSLAGVPPSMLPPVNPNPISAPSPSQYLPSFQDSTPSSRSMSNANTPPTFSPNHPVHQGKQINDNTPPLIPSQSFQPVMNGPQGPGPGLPQTGPYPPTSRAFSPPVYNKPPVSVHNFGPPGSVHQAIGPLQSGAAPSQQAPYSGPSSNSLPRNSPIIPGPPVSRPMTSGLPRTLAMNGSSITAGLPPMSHAGPPMSQAAPMNQTGSHMSHVGPPMSQKGPSMSQSGPPMVQAGPPMSQARPMGQAGPPMSQAGPPMSQAAPMNQTGSHMSHVGPLANQSQSGPPVGQAGPPMGQAGPPMGQAGPSMSQSGHMGQARPPMSQPGPFMTRPGPLMSQAGPPMSQPGPINQAGPPIGQMMGGPLLRPSSAPNVGAPTNVASLGPPMGVQTASASPLNNGPIQMAPPQMGPPQMGQMGPPQMGPPRMGPPPMSAPQMGPPLIGQSAGLQQRGLLAGPPLGPLGQPNSLPPGLQTPQNLQGTPLGPQQVGLQSGPQSLPPSIAPPAPTAGAPKGNMQNRYPSMPQSNFSGQSPQMVPQQYNAQPITQQMGNLSVTKQGFDQLWGHQNIDLMQNRNILPEYPDDPPEIRLGNQFAEANNCSPDIFRCTVNRIPENNSLLQKSRLPLGILIHPFKDLNHLPVIQCATIVRCRACRTYINPFVYFVDQKRWKCNLCYRVNDLPEEFQYDPVSKSYGDPARRPEIKSATIEFIAPGEYMLRPPQPAVYLFLLDVSQLARESRYLEVVCKTLQDNLDQLPGDARTQVGFICFDSHIHYYLMSEGLTRPKEMTVLDIDEVFLPSPESLLVNLGERRSVVAELLSALPSRHVTPGAPASALGAALQAAYKLMAPTGGRVTVFQTCLPNVGPGALTAREDPNARSAKDVAHLNPATDFYKRLALDCSGAQIAVDLFLLNSQYSDLATLSGMSKFSGGTVYHIPLFSAARAWQAEQLRRTLHRYLTRKIGFEAVMRVRATRGISIHTFHGNFFVRSTDLLSLPNVSPDAGFGMQLSIDESLADLQQVCFQAALLYTSSKGERRIRVHTLALPIASTLPDVLHAADQQCIIGLLSKMAVDRCASASMSEAREAITNVAIDVLSAHRLAQNLPAGAASNSLFAPGSLRLLPLYLLGLLKRRAFRTGTSTRLDDRVFDMCNMKTLPLHQLLRSVYPDLFPVHQLSDCADDCDPPALQLSAEKIYSTGAYILDDGETIILYVGHAVSPAYLSETFGVASFSQLPDEARTLPRIESDGNQLLHLLIEKLNDDRPYPSNLLVLRDNSPSRALFTGKLVDDRLESTFAYYDFLQHVKSQVK